MHILILNILEKKIQKEHPDFKIALSFNGVQLDFFQRKYPEFIDILRQLIAKKQLEILGGGYYDPVFPLLLPVDRAGQIEKRFFREISFVKDINIP